MENEVMRYFNSCSSLSEAQKRQCNRVATWLCRCGVTTMAELCRLYEQRPEKIKRFRNIGEKGFELIAGICNKYKNIEGGFSYDVS